MRWDSFRVADYSSRTSLSLATNPVSGHSLSWLRFCHFKECAVTDQRARSDPQYQRTVGPSA